MQSQEPEESKIQKLFSLHEQTTAAMRLELAGRSAGEVEYDDYLLAQMRKGKPFKIALRKANAKFPSEAMTPQAENLADVEAHYQFILDMQQLDLYRQNIESSTRQIHECDRKIAELLENNFPRSHGA